MAKAAIKPTVIIPPEWEQKYTFESALEELETIVAQLSEATVPLAEALKLYEQGIKLAEFCGQQLQTTEQRVQFLNQAGKILKAKPTVRRRKKTDLDITG